MDQQSPWESPASGRLRISLRAFEGSRLFEAWRDAIDEASCSVVGSKCSFSDSAGQRAEAVYPATGPERAVPIRFDCCKEEQSHRVDTGPGRPAKYLGGRRARIRGPADHKIKRG